MPVKCITAMPPPTMAPPISAAPRTDLVNAMASPAPVRTIAAISENTVGAMP